MNLQFIRTDACPVCNQKTVVDESIEVDVFGDNRKIRKHSNGGQWESRTFLCGQKVTFSPNGGPDELSTYYVCTQNEEYKEAKVKRQHAIKQSKVLIENMIDDVDEDFKQTIISRIEGAKHYA